jgi:peptide/nickel transport system permease protein
MGWYVVRRIAVAMVLAWLLSVITFAMYFKIPADPAGFLVDIQHSTPDQIEKAQHALGVDRPVYVQYAKYVERALHGDLGFSWQTAFVFSGQVEGIPVAPTVVRALGVTASLVLGGMLLLLLVAIPLGTFVATRPRSWTDRATIAFSIAAISTHPLVVGLLLQLFAGNRWHIAPPSGYCPFFGSAPDTSSPQFNNFVSPENVPSCGGPFDWAYHLVLPWLTFALFFVALYLRMMRARMIEVLGEPYVRTARAKGASELVVVRRHALRNALSPIVTMIGMDAGMAIGIAMYIETVFNLPGLGRTTIGALNNPAGFDLPIILGVTLFAGVVIILLNLFVDLALLVIDPTISRRRGRGELRAAHGPAA